jgi:hypothetical protein
VNVVVAYRNCLDTLVIFGLPSWFITIAPGDVNNPLVLQLSSLPADMHRMLDAAVKHASITQPAATMQCFYSISNYD